MIRGQSHPRPERFEKVRTTGEVTVRDGRLPLSWQPNSEVTSGCSAGGGLSWPPSRCIMNRAWQSALLMLALAGCQLPPEQVPLKPLVENGPAQPYADLVSRARVQAAAANEAFYVDKWFDLEDAGKGLENTARFM